MVPWLSQSVSPPSGSPCTKSPPGNSRGNRGLGVTPVSMMATVTPAPVEYCQACSMLSMVLPGSGCATLGSPTTTGVTHALVWRISWGGPGVSSGGSAPGSITGGATASAAGGASTLALSSPNAARPAATLLPRISAT